MGFRQAEEVTLPLRFLTLTAHLVAVLCIVLDLDRTAARIAETESEISEISEVLEPLAYTAMATLLVEVVGLFAGATIFNRGLACIYILFHFIGAILTGLFVEQRWNVDALIVIFTIFNAFPCT
eukprot:CAMPEP_0177766274 /NCGR_PEP_ID=MMETSP0491_2-20121128/8441_1 /TAXON_ID=63592 /ORGANISM="Tetraselmis chuii, Strain PLY429" /LENGTH=123 /DNA_ID=CAMNT_0019282685 /DNA_START=246 /DNA_END=614 /DNA_ORIENTATION=-